MNVAAASADMSYIQHSGIKPGIYSMMYYSQPALPRFVRLDGGTIRESELPPTSSRRMSVQR